MATVAVYNTEGKEVDKLELNDAVFGVEINEHLVHMAVVAQLANKRQGTQSAKTRAEVRGTLETERNWSCQTGFYKISSVDRWWSSIRTKAKRLLYEVKQERESKRNEVCINF